MNWVGILKKLIKICVKELEDHQDQQEKPQQKPPSGGYPGQQHQQQNQQQQIQKTNRKLLPENVSVC